MSTDGLSLMGTGGTGLADIVASACLAEAAGFESAWAREDDAVIPISDRVGR